MNEIKLLFGTKGEALCRRFFSLYRRFPKVCSSTLLKELGCFLSNASETFLENHELFFLSKIFLSQLRFLQKESSSSTQRVRIKILEIRPSVYGMVVAIYTLDDQESFTEEHILKGVQRLIPAVKQISSSYFTSKRGNIQIFYLEILKMRGGIFSHEEKEKLCQELPSVFQKELDPWALFFPGNEEELFKKIRHLSQELKFVRDLPQVMITFVEYFQEKLKFLVTVVRFVTPEMPSIRELSSKLSSLVQFSIENQICLERVRKKYLKEASIFTLELSSSPFLRSGNVANLRMARQYVAKELESMLGPFRDYNGGLLHKENEQLIATKRLLEKKGLAFPFLEDFFYSIKPIALKAVILPKTALEFISLFQKIAPSPLNGEQKYSFEATLSRDVNLIIIKTKEKEWKSLLSQNVLRHASHIGFSCIEYEGFLYLTFFQQFPENEALLEIIKKELLHISSSAKPKKENILRINFQGGDPPTLNPRLASDINCHILSKLLFEGLTEITPEGNVAFAAAEKVVISPNKKHYTFYLRDSWWSNGEQVTAYHFERAWKKAILAESESRMYLSFFASIKNAKKAISRELPIDAIGVHAKNGKTLCVELEAPCAHFLNLTASPPFFPLYGESEEPVDFNGAFALSEWKRDQWLYLSKNPFYRNASKIQLRGIKISMIRDSYFAYDMFQKNELDIIGDPINPLPTTILKEVASHGNLHSKRVSRIFWIHCNTEIFPLNNAHLRYALSLAIDRTRLAEHVFFNQTAHFSPLPPKYACTQKRPSADISEAQKHFKQALCELNLQMNSFPPLVLNHSDLCYEKPLFQELQRQWKEHLGITVISKQLPWSEFSASLEKKNYQLGGLFRRDLYHHPLFYLAFFKNSPYNPHAWQNSEYEKLLEQYCQKPSKKELLKKLETFLIEKAPVIPLVNQNFFYLTNPYVKGIKFSENGCLDLMEARIDENS